MTGVWRKGGLAALAAVLAIFLYGGAVQSAGKGGSHASGKDRGNHSGGKHSGQHHHRRGSGVALGAFWGAAYWPWWDYLYYYPLAGPEATLPVEYIERTEQEADTAHVWYFCEKAQGYFPYVGECADGWQRVPAAPVKGRDEGASREFHSH